MSRGTSARNECHMIFLSKYLITLIILVYLSLSLSSLFSLFLSFITRIDYVRLILWHRIPVEGRGTSITSPQFSLRKTRGIRVRFRELLDLSGRLPQRLRSAGRTVLPCMSFREFKVHSPVCQGFFLVMLLRICKAVYCVFIYSLGFISVRFEKFDG